jgi:hypothetical protein
LAPLLFFAILILAEAKEGRAKAPTHQEQKYEKQQQLEPGNVLSIVVK